MTKEEWYKQLFSRLNNSKFRSSFHLKQKDIDYINEKGMETIREHAREFIFKRRDLIRWIEILKTCPIINFLIQRIEALVSRKMLLKHIVQEKI